MVLPDAPEYGIEATPAVAASWGLDKVNGGAG